MTGPTPAVPLPRNPVAQIITPLTYMDALAIADDALMNGDGVKLPYILQRARVAAALTRVDEKSREQATTPLIHDETKCRHCIAIAEQRSNEKYEEDRAS